jgi:hypothetical protein
MIFTDEDLRKYQELCRKYFDEEVDERAAMEEMTALVYMVGLIYRPSLRSDLEKLRQVKNRHTPDGETGNEPHVDT